MVLSVYVILFCALSQVYTQNEIKIFGPGLNPKEIVMSARYFFVNFTFVTEHSYTSNLANDLAVEINGSSMKHRDCRVWVNKLDRKDGTFIIRYKVYETCQDMSISVYYKSKHITGSPYHYAGPIQPDQCDCPEQDINVWLEKYGCPESFTKINQDLKPFINVDMAVNVPKIVEKYHKPDTTSFCHYVIKNNKIYRDCYGKHVGFNMFSDNVLLSLSRKVRLPDMELVINLGDWPLIRKNTELLPVFSWCGSEDTMDIVMPTYDLTESTLENMGRVTLDILSVQGNVEKPWEAREPRAFWRGRDSRAERLQLVDVARANPDLFNVSLTNFFFFLDKQEQYGPKSPHISFFKFFDYKYQINIDGTVASYRLPYLLAGGGTVMKQTSPYYEHFYGQLVPWEHFVPVSRDLSDLAQRARWARAHDEEALKIARNGRKFVNDHLLPQHIFCYHAVLFQEWSKRMTNKVNVRKGMTEVPQPTFGCDCEPKEKKKREDL
ncbi:protein O-glucosyltransferase 2-like isoform X1 [Cydia splendana]|uniref:protein O-glucosyltransferase 2-like isoform X1 n=2 Tax=Cydia splendana TaxID=1100963 RepID=UPI00213EC328